MSRSHRFRRALVVAFGITAWAGSASADARSYTHEALALLGDSVPGVEGEVFIDFGYETAINASGEVAFHGIWTYTQPGGDGIFRVASDSAAPVAVALPGDPAPGTGGGSYLNFGAPCLSDSGEVAFKANVTGGSAANGVFVVSGATHTARVLDGQQSPGGGTYHQGFTVEQPCLDATGTLVFLGSGVGVVRDVAGNATLLAGVGQVAPGTGGETFTAFGAPSIDAHGEVAFGGAITGGISDHAIFLYDGSSTVLLARKGDPAPGTGGGSFLTVTGEVISAAGDVAFFSRIVDGTASSGLYLARDGAIVPVAVLGGSAPGTGGGTFDFLGPPTVNERREVAFVADMAGGTLPVGLFVDDGAGRVAVGFGDPAPSTVGGTFTGLALPKIGGSGDLSFLAGVQGGSSTLGIFRSRALRAVPGLPPVGLVMTGLALAACARALLPRRAGKPGSRGWSRRADSNR